MRLIAVWLCGGPVYLWILLVVFVVVVASSTTLHTHTQTHTIQHSSRPHTQLAGETKKTVA